MILWMLTKLDWHICWTGRFPESSAVLLFSGNERIRDDSEQKASQPSYVEGFEIAG